MIPDSVQGAITLSVIDFFLSFVVISGIGIVLSLFPYLNRLGSKLQETPVSISVVPDRDQNAEVAAVIGAAIYRGAGCPPTRPHRRGAATHGRRLDLADPLASAHLAHPAQPLSKQ